MQAAEFPNRNSTADQDADFLTATTSAQPQERDSRGRCSEVRSTGDASVLAVHHGDFAVARNPDRVKKALAHLLAARIRPANLGKAERYD
jgi:hypothetical protein